MNKESIDRINFLARKQKTPEGLTEEEKKEQHTLRQQYLGEIRLSFGGMLENTVIERPDGTREKLKKK